MFDFATLNDSVAYFKLNDDACHVLVPPESISHNDLPWRTNILFEINFVNASYTN